MEKIAIVTDSCADVPQEYKEKYDIYTVPMMITSNNRSYKDGIDILSEDVYKLQKTEILKTSSPQGNDVIATLETIKAKGYSHVIILTIASALSGTVNQIRLFAQDVENLVVEVFDSKSASIGNGVIVIEVAKLRDQGFSFSQLVQKIPDIINQTYVYFSIDTLEYLQKGGRIGKATAFVGGALKIKPILSFDKEDGMIYVPSKVRGNKKVKGQLIKLIAKKIEEHPHQTFNLVVADGGNEENHQLLEQELKELYPQVNDVINTQIGAALSTYLGSGLLGAGVQFID